VCHANTRFLYFVDIKGINFFLKIDYAGFTMKTHKTTLKNTVCIFISVGGQDILDPAMPV